ncbi:hypothetical protein Bca52824_028729 [Brassica carinata]|uniref:EF-hand domain-containing protein n=1 Tax=Brassica carinata TaxID=52824 RepID=A0A8X7VCZ4_BRACI|nr:hypothetical protein Bca52824_028729 [Brassica carinata]
MKMKIIHDWWSQRHNIVKTIVEASIEVDSKNKKSVGIMLLSLAPFLMYVDQSSQQKSLDHARFEIMSEVHRLLKRFSPKSFIENGKISEESMKSLFEITDTNNDGKIQLSELRDFNIEFWNFGRMKCEIDKLAKDFLEKFDKDKDGQLDEEEFEEGVTSLLKKHKFN